MGLRSERGCYGRGEKMFVVVGRVGTLAQGYVDLVTDRIIGGILQVFGEIGRVCGQDPAQFLGCLRREFRVAFGQRGVGLGQDVMGLAAELIDCVSQVHRFTRQRLAFLRSSAT